MDSRWRPLRADTPDLVGRDFTADRPDQLYAADFTYLRCWEGLVYLAFVIDLYSRRVVGWQLTSHMRASLVLRRAEDGRRHPPAWRRRQFGAPLGPRVASWTQPVVATLCI